ncbi:hypothetical protein KBD08_04415, partial [Candidatus Babeliales bacterium]|nr:hypothetical protein [Candidatus Babeliales bacterium]
MKHKLLIIAVMLSANLIFGADAAGYVQDALPKDYTFTVQPKKLDKINDSYVKQLLENVEQYRLAHLSDDKRDFNIYRIHNGNFENLMTPTLQDDMNNLGFMNYQNKVGYNICYWGTFGDFVDYAQQAYEKSLEVIHRVDHVLKDGIEKLSIPQDRKKNMLEAIDSDTELKRKELYNSFVRVRSAFDSVFLYFDNMLSKDKEYMCTTQAQYTANMVHPFN